MVPVVTVVTLGTLAATPERPWPPGTTLAAVAVLSLVGLAALAYRRPRLCGTTLVASWCWSVVSLVALAAVEIGVCLADAQPTPAWVVPLRLAAAMSTFCPTMAVLGAKRPQDRPWQFIVLALWAILSLPSLEWLFFGGVQEIHPARFVFLAILIGAGALNGLGTRYWGASLLFCCGQVALIAPHLAVAEPWLSESRGPLAGLALIAAAWTLLAAEVPRRTRAAAPLDRVWLDFRDAFGVLWSLRVIERMNATATLVDWPVTLTWHGFLPRTSDTSAVEIPASIEESFRTLLRRFVSSDWIDQRKGDILDYSKK